MKILRVVGSMDPRHGGVVEAINQAAQSFNNERHQMDVMCFDSLDSPWVKSNECYKIHAINKGKTSYSFHFQYLIWLWKNAKNYDAVILDGLWLYLTWGGYLLKLLKVPYCVFTHGMLDPYFNQDKLKFIKKLPFWFMVERNVIAGASATIFTCKEESMLAKKSFPFYSATPKIATLGVEGNSKGQVVLADIFYKKCPDLKNKRFALFLSRINKKKGIDLLIGALAQLKGLPDDFVIAIAGPDSAGLKNKLIKQLEALGISQKVHWLGMLHGDLKWGAYHASEVFILPSHQENFGIVVAEALSTATPVLITNKVNIWREIEVAQAGIVENDDIQGVKGLLRKWLSLKVGDKKIMSQQALLCYENNFSIKSAASDLERVLLEISGQRVEVENA